MTQQILPTKAPAGEQFESLYRIYKLEYERAQPEFHIENVRFVHDPHWREKWLSVHHIGDVERKMIAGALSPFTMFETVIVGGIYWKLFDHYDTRPKERPRAMPPTVKPVTT